MAGGVKPESTFANVGSGGRRTKGTSGRGDQKLLAGGPVEKS